MRKALYILGQLTDLDIEWLLEHGQRQTVSPGQVIIRQGQAIAAVYLTLDGQYAVRDERLGRELARLGAGEVLGEMSFVDSSPPSATVLALEPGRLLALPRQTLQQKLNQDAAFAARFYRALAVFLSDRLRASVRTLGYGDNSATLDDSIQQADELDLAVLDDVHRAGARFAHILQRLAGA